MDWPIGREQDRVIAPRIIMLDDARAGHPDRNSALLFTFFLTIVFGVCFAHSKVLLRHTILLVFKW